MLYKLAAVVVVVDAALLRVVAREALRMVEAEALTLTAEVGVAAAAADIPGSD